MSTRLPGINKIWEGPLPPNLPLAVSHVVSVQAGALSRGAHLGTVKRYHVLLLSVPLSCRICCHHVLYISIPHWHSSAVLLTTPVKFEVICRRLSFPSFAYTKRRSCITTEFISSPLLSTPSAAAQCPVPPSRCIPENASLTRGAFAAVRPLHIT